MNKLNVFLGILISFATLIGAAFIVDARFAKQDMVIKADTELSAEIAGVSKRLDQQIKQDRAKALQEQLWFLERYYGVEKAKIMGEYKRLEAEREEILRGLK